MIMLQAIACSHGVEPVKNGTALASTKATLRAPDVGTLEHPTMCARLRSRLSALRTLPKATTDPEKSAPCFSLSSPRRGQNAFKDRQTRNDQRFTTDLTWISLLARRRSMPSCIVALTFRHARTARMRWERVAFLSLSTKRR